MSNDLAWTPDQYSFGFGRSFRLLCRGQLTNVVLDEDGAIFRDALPCDVPEVAQDGFLDQVRSLTISGEIPTADNVTMPVGAPAQDDLMTVDDRTIHNASRVSGNMQKDEFGQIISGGASDVLQQRLKEERRQQMQETRRLATIIVMCGGIILLILLTILHGTGVITLGSGNDDDVPVNRVERIDYTEPTDEGLSPFQGTEKIDKEDLPGITGKVNWRQSIDSEISVSSFDAGTVTVDSNNLMTFYDSQSGVPFGQLKMPSDLTYLNETTIDGGVPAISWRSKNTLYVWSMDDRDRGPMAIGLNTTSRVSLSGKELMIIDGDQAKVIASDGLVDVRTPSGQNILANEGDSIVTSDWDGPIHRIDPRSGDILDTVGLKPPEKGMEVERWISTGRGLAIVAWSRAEDKSDPDADVTVTITSLDDGKILNSIGDKLSNIQDISWSRGQGSQLAGFGNRLVSMETGEVVYDGVKENMTFSYIAGNYALGTQGGDSFLIKDGKKTEAKFIPTAVLHDGSIIARISSMEFISLEGS